MSQEKTNNTKEIVFKKKAFKRSVLFWSTPKFETNLKFKMNKQNLIYKIIIII